MKNTMKVSALVVVAAAMLVATPTTLHAQSAWQKIKDAAKQTGQTTVEQQTQQLQQQALLGQAQPGQPNGKPPCGDLADEAGQVDNDHIVAHGGGGHCGPHCFPAGPFSATVTNVTKSQAGRYQVLRINVLFRNTTTKPIILGYHAGTSLVTDNLGHIFYWGRPSTHDTSVTGIGIDEGRTVNTQFSLQPGQSSSATFSLNDFGTTKGAPGNQFHWDVTIDHIDPGNPTNVVRQFAINFNDITGR